MRDDEKRAQTNEGGAEGAGQTSSQQADAEATSAETLADVERKEEVPDASNADGGRTESPSPDGAFDDSRSDRDPSGPM